MDPTYSKSETTHCNDESNSIDSDDHCHCPVEASEQNNLNANNQNNIFVNNKNSYCQNNACTAETLECYHERTSSCESTSSSLSCSSYNSSNSSGILLSVSNLGPESKSDVIKANHLDGYDISRNEIKENDESPTILDTESSQNNSKIRQYSQICDVVIRKHEKFVSPHDINNVNQKPDFSNCPTKCSDQSTKTPKSKKLLDFSVIKLRGKNILLHKHDSKMGQSANGAASEHTSSSNSITIGTCQKKESMSAIKSSKNIQSVNHIACDIGDKTMDEIDNHILSKRPEPEGQDPSVDHGMSFSSAASDIPKTASYLKLEAELVNVQKELKLKEEENIKLSRIRDEVESEMSELTASLFQEAHRMVGEANVKRASAEKFLAESNMKIDGLETEVAALKTLVLTSTPSQPNRHLHPQLTAMDNKNNGSQTKSNGHGSNNSLLQGYANN